MSDPLASQTDEELVRICRTGSLPAFEVLVERYESRIYHFIAGRVSNRQDAEDLTQNIFITAYRKLDRFNPAYQFVTWLFTIARRSTISHFRAQRKPVDQAVEEIDVRSPFVLLAEEEDRGHFWQGLRDVLSEKQFTALWLKYEEDLSIRDIARAMRASQAQVKVLLFRARRKLAEQGMGCLAARIPVASPNRFQLKESHL